MNSRHPVTCYCPDCRAADHARQRKLTFVLSTILAAAVWILIGEMRK